MSQIPELSASARTPRIRFDIISIFPEFFSPWQSLGVCGRSVVQGVVQVQHWNPRQFTDDLHQTIDDRPYGGGPGMVMMAPPLAACIGAILADLTALGQRPGPVILFSPAGEVLNQAVVEQIRTQVLAAIAEAQLTQFTLVCGRYEGVDQRFIDRYVDLEISLGDFVLSGGEIPALALMDALVRRIPGVLNDDMSSVAESFMQTLLDHPHYTRPEVFEGEPAPAVLLSGHHGKIADWRNKQAVALTQSRRPDLLKRSNS